MTVRKESPLFNWTSLNKALQRMKEEDCWKLLKEEKAGRARKMFLLRIHGVANKLRRRREREELVPTRRVRKGARP